MSTSHCVVAVGQISVGNMKYLTEGRKQSFRMRMIEIDGSHGEGGGQILRTSVSLSALTMKPIRITNIRARRPQPGLKRQHLTGIELTGQLVDADVEGLEIGSTTVEFVPKVRRGGRFTLDVGTAGSISLVLQAALPASVLAPEPTSFSLRGGTDVKWSPPVDYLEHVFGPLLEKMGPRLEINQARRGHYPKGGGIVECTIHPVESLIHVDRVEFGELRSVSGISHCVRLPAHVAERQAKSAASILQRELGLDPEIRLETYRKERDPHLGPGSGIAIWADSKTGNRLGADSRGDRGIRAEEVGISAAERLVQDLSADRAVDSHLADMAIPYLAVAEGTSRLGVTEVTSHLLTNIWTVQQILRTKIEVDGKRGEPGVVRVQGEGLSV